MNYAYDWDFFSIFPMLKCPTFRCKIFRRDQNALVLKINTSRVASIHFIFPHSPNLRCGGNHILLLFYCTYFGHFVLPSIQSSSRVYWLFLHALHFISVCSFFSCKFCFHIICPQNISCLFLSAIISFHVFPVFLKTSFLRACLVHGIF